MNVVVGALCRATYVTTKRTVAYIRFLPICIDYSVPGLSNSTKLDCLRAVPNTITCRVCITKLNIAVVTPFRYVFPKTLTKRYMYTPAWVNTRKAKGRPIDGHQKNKLAHKIEKMKQNWIGFLVFDVTVFKGLKHHMLHCRSNWQQNLEVEFRFIDLECAISYS